MSYRAMPCSSPGCTDPAVCRPVVLIASKKLTVNRAGRSPNRFYVNFRGEDSYELQYEIVMQFCNCHMMSFNLKTLMGEACWSAIENQLAALGYASPDRDSVRVLWKDATGDDGLQLQTFDEYEDDILAQHRTEQFRQIKSALRV